jgi:hypothetical protein
MRNQWDGWMVAYYTKKADLTDVANLRALAQPGRR